MNKDMQEKLNIDLTKCKMICESTDRIVKEEFIGTMYEILKKMDAEFEFDYENFVYNYEDMIDDELYDVDAIDQVLIKSVEQGEDVNDVIYELIKNYGAGYYQTTEDLDEYEYE